MGWLLWFGALQSKSVIPPPVDTSVFSGSAVALSMRIPSGSTYSGPLIRVRRSSDNTEMDINAVSSPDGNGNRFIDTTALLAFTGAGNGFITVWYDQSGNSRNFSQAATSSQFRLVQAGAIDGVGTIPMPRQAGNVQFMQCSTSDWLVTGDGSRALNCVMARRGVNGTASVYYVSPSGTDNSFFIYSSPTSDASVLCPKTNPSTGVDPHRAQLAAGVNAVFTALHIPGTTSGFVNGTSVGSNSQTLSTVSGIFCWGNGPNSNAAAFLGEMTYFATSITSTQRQNLESSQGVAFGVTIPS